METRTLHSPALCGVKKCLEPLLGTGSTIWARELPGLRFNVAALLYSLQSLLNSGYHASLVSWPGSNGRYLLWTAPCSFIREHPLQIFLGGLGSVSLLHL